MKRQLGLQLPYPRAAIRVQCKLLRCEPASLNLKPLLLYQTTRHKLLIWHNWRTTR
jgi:hypothetical protein